MVIMIATMTITTATIATMTIKQNCPEENPKENITDYSPKDNEVIRQFLDDQHFKANPVENNPPWKPMKSISSRRKNT